MGRINHDSEDPGTELPSRIVSVDVPPRREKAILCGVVGVFGVVKDSPRHPSRRRPVAPDQLTERLTVTLLGGQRPGRRRLSQDYAADDSDVEFRTPARPGYLIDEASRTGRLDGKLLAGQRDRCRSIRIGRE